MKPETIMPDGRPLFAWQNELAMLRSRDEANVKMLKELAIFKTACGIIYERRKNYETLDWVFKISALDVVSDTQFYEHLANYLHIENVKQ